jgi:primosomal protein N'
MYYYSVLVERKLPQEFLTYTSQVALPIGQVVEVPISSSQVPGIVYFDVSDKKFDISTIKEISTLFPLILSDIQLQYIQSVAYNTFNRSNTVWRACWLPLKNFSKKDYNSLTEINKSHNLKKVQVTTKLSKSDQNEGNSKTKPLDITFSVHPDVLIRIMAIIRNVISSKNTHTLILFPEQKLLERIYEEVISQSNSKDVQCLKFNGSIRKSNRDTILQILKPDEDKHQILFSTRAGLFLPFTALQSIIVVDESNAMYIQDQNQLYYDGRDVAVLLAQAWNCKIDFISTVPSIRLHSFYSQTLLDEWSTTITNSDIKMPHVSIIERQPYQKDFAYIIRNVIETNEENYFYEDESEHNFTIF